MRNTCPPLARARYLTIFVFVIYLLHLMAHEAASGASAQLPLAYRSAPSHKV
jgi:hypothetical protein